MSIGCDHEITGWIRRLSSAQAPQAAQQLWNHYRQRLLVLARRKLGSNRRVSDEEDVVVSAFGSFWRATAAGRLPRLDDRNDLWRVLSVITARKAVDHLRYQHRQKRRGVFGESALGATDESGFVGGIARLIDREPSPEVAAMLAEQCEQMLVRLGGDSLRRIALMRLENYSVVEIARKLDCSVRTVKRRLAIIRKEWEGEPLE